MALAWAIPMTRNKKTGKTEKIPETDQFVITTHGGELWQTWVTEWNVAFNIEAKVEKLSSIGLKKSRVE